MKYFIIFIVAQMITQPILCQLVPLGTKCGCFDVPVERKCGCFDVPMLPKQEFISPMNDISFGSQGQNILLRNGILGNQNANIIPWNRGANLIGNIPVNNMYMPNKMVTTRSLSPLKTPVPMQQYNKLPNYIDNIRRNQNIMNIKSQLAQLAGLAMASANLLSSLPTYSNNLITKNALNSLPMPGLGLGNVGFKPISYQNNIVPRLF